MVEAKYRIQLCKVQAAELRRLTDNLGSGMFSDFHVCTATSLNSCSRSRNACENRPGL